jgi:hypothetical protein
MLDAILSGGLTGLLGTGIGAVTSYFAKKQELEATKVANIQELAMANEDRQTLELEQKGQLQVANIEAEATAYLQDTELRKASSRMDRAAYSDGPKYADYGIAGKVYDGLLVLVDFVRGLARPGLTGLLIYLVYVLMSKAYAAAGPTMTQEVAANLIAEMQTTVLYLTTSAVTWWFGDRARAKIQAHT